MKLDFLIIGQGIAGTVLCHKLLSLGKKVKVIDVPLEGRSSHVAAGIINPVTGRNYVKSWLIDQLLPVAKETYLSLEQLLGKSFLAHKKILRALNSPKDENAWIARTGDPFYQNYIEDCIADPVNFKHIIKAYSHGMIKEAYQLQIASLLKEYRSYLIRHDLLIEKEISVDGLHDYMQQSKLQPEYVIFCEGHRVINNPLWNYLPFDPVKGEMFLIKAPNLVYKENYRHRMFLTHLYDEVYWVGASYIKQYLQLGTTDQEYQKLKDFLEEILDCEYKILSHQAGIRPAVKTRKPLIGRHPKFSNYILFNGFGAKGSSLVPYFAEQLIGYLLEGKELSSEVDISKYN